MNEDPIQPRDEFGHGLGAIYRTKLPVSAQVDDAILNRARAHFARRGSRNLPWRIGVLITAAAAVLVITVYLNKPQPAAQNAMDIVAALRVARDIRAGRADVARDDFNRDGAVDQSDVEAIAMAAVRLPEEKVQ